MNRSKKIQNQFKFYSRRSSNLWLERLLTGRILWPGWPDAHLCHLRVQRRAQTHLPWRDQDQDHLQHLGEGLGLHSNSKIFLVKLYDLSRRKLLISPFVPVILTPYVNKILWLLPSYIHSRLMYFLNTKTTELCCGTAGQARKLWCHQIILIEPHHWTT